MKKYGKIAVFAGGISNEREISLKSGRAVYGALKKRLKDVDFIDINHGFRKKLKKIKHDIVFLALHGKFGEDGTVQAMLEELNIVYTGSGVFASRLAMDKIASREAFLLGGLKMPPYKTINKKDRERARIFEEFETPFVVKPQMGGSSIGLSVVRQRTCAKEALRKAFQEGDTVIVEKYIHGRELTVSILEDEALPVIEIVTKDNVYDFDAKYSDRETKYLLPAVLDEDLYKRTQETALKAYKILGCRDFSRVDMRMDERKNIYILEVNTIPGLTERSLLPKAALARGMDFGDLCMRLIDLAHKRRNMHGKK